MKMTKQFLGEDFLLENPTAQRLYHTYAKALPIFDYHNHLSPERIAQNTPFQHLTEAWLDGDHYKWRAMNCSLYFSESFISLDTFRTTTLFWHH